jgi:GT2 family glycosyltransferase
LVRLHGTPIGYVQVAVEDGRCLAESLASAILEKHTGAITRHLLSDSLALGMKPTEFDIDDLAKVPHPVYTGPLPTVTVAVCTRDRTASLKRCLDSLNLVSYPGLELIVVDNAPTNDSTERLVHEYPHVRYISEPRPGLDWARNRAILEAHGEIIAYTDDDVVVDPNWISSMATLFAQDAEVMAITGLVVPHELETEAQILFEKNGGFGRGFQRKWYRDRKKAARSHAGTGKFGTGANMAYRRDLFNHIGFFDPALDMGTSTNGGGDLDMFFRVIKEGHTLVYEPSALVRHVHRHDLEGLRRQMFSWGTGFCSYVVRNSLTYPHETMGFLKLGLRWFWKRNVRRLLLSLLRPPSFPRSLIIAEMWGSLIGVFQYSRARSIAKKVEEKFGPLAHTEACAANKPKEEMVNQNNGYAVRSVDLCQCPRTLTDVADYPVTRVFVSRANRLLGHVEIANEHGTISSTRLHDAVVEHFNLKLLPESDTSSLNFVTAEILTILRRHYMQTNGTSKSDTFGRLPVDIPVSIVIATYDRPNLLRKCLRSILGQETSRPVEIIVVDNHPASHLTPPVVAKFPEVVLVNEPRQGLSYARNAGIVASKGKIIIATDDDVLSPSGWLEKLVAPFARDDVMIVTGNVLPFQLETSARKLFEIYGGLQRGFERREADKNWFESFKRRAVPTWELGATANVAFRAILFSDPQIGLLDEVLGPGTPTCCGEDTYLFYKVLNAGYSLVYEPEAYVWHEHRRDISSLRRQIYGYSKGHVAYHLTTLIRDHDLRSLSRLMIDLPRWHLRSIKQWIHGRRTYPLSLVMIEIMGHLVGPFALWRSWRRVKREGRSIPYLPRPVPEFSESETTKRLSSLKPNSLEQSTNLQQEADTSEITLSSIAQRSK